MIFPIRTDSPLRTHALHELGDHRGQRGGRSSSQQARAASSTTALPLYPHDPALPTFFTYAFLHGGSVHMMGNMLFLYIFGNNVNDKMGHVGYLGFYLAGGGVRGRRVRALSHERGVPVLGASGAVAAVTGRVPRPVPARDASPSSTSSSSSARSRCPACGSSCLFFVEGPARLLGPHGQRRRPRRAHRRDGVRLPRRAWCCWRSHLLPRDQFDVLALIQPVEPAAAVPRHGQPGLQPVRLRPRRRGGARRRRRRGGIRAGRSAAATADRCPTRAVVGLRASDLRGRRPPRHGTPPPQQLPSSCGALDPRQVLSRQAQLDVANHLAGQQHYAEAAEAYEAFLTTLPEVRADRAGPADARPRSTPATSANPPRPGSTWRPPSRASTPTGSADGPRRARARRRDSP